MSDARPVSGGGALTDQQRAHARAVLRHAGVELPNVRKAAERWQVGLAGLVAGIGLFAGVRGDEAIGALEAPWRVVAGVSIALGLATSMLAVVLSMRAAYGLPRLRSTSSDDWTSDHPAAVAAADQLRSAMRLTIVAIVLALGGVAASWFAPEADDDPSVRLVVDGGERICGRVVRVSSSAWTIDTSDGERTVALADLEAVSAVPSC